MEMPELEKDLRALFTLLVTKPEALKFRFIEAEDTRGKYIRVYVRSDLNDTRVLLGEKGINAEAIRRIITIIGVRHTNERVYGQIVSGKWRKEIAM